MTRLLIVSHTPHYRLGGNVVGWGPTVRELDFLADLFTSVVHVAPLYDEPAPASALAYTSPRVSLRPVAPAGGDTLRTKADILLSYPAYGRTIKEELDAADAVHVRCPANISLLALWLLQRREEPRPRWIKYAGNWRPDGDDPRTYALQRDWLQRDPRATVTVNGRWPDQPEHVLSFDNPSLTEEEIADGRAAATGKRLTAPLEMLFVGALNDAKGAGRALEVSRRLVELRVDHRLHILGDGPDRPRYEAWAADHHVPAIFHGWIPRAELASHYATAHVVLLPSASEGWPKVLSEAMAYGAVPVASAVSSIPQILDETGAGFACPATDIDAFAEAIQALVGVPERWAAASHAGVAAASRFTYRTYQRAVSDLFLHRFGLRLAVGATEAAAEVDYA